MYRCVPPFEALPYPPRVGPTQTHAKQECMAVLEFFQPSVKLHNRHISSYTFTLCDLYITYIICICLSSNRFLLFFLRLLCVVYCFLLLGPPSILRRGLKSHQPKKSMSFPLDAESWFQIKDSHGILRGLSNPQSPKGCQLHPPSPWIPLP